MAFGAKRTATQAPGIGAQPFSSVVFDPVTVNAVRFVEALAAFGEFGIRYPYNNGSATDIVISSNSNLTDTITRARHITINAGITWTVQRSPVFIFANSISLLSGAIISADGRGGAGGTGGPATSAKHGQPGQPGDLGYQSDVVSAPQYSYGISTGGGGGGGWFNVSNGGNGGPGGRAAGTLTGGAAGAGGVSGDTSGKNGTAGEAVFGWPLLGSAVRHYLSHRGGGGGGGGGNGNNNTFAGGDGGNGGGIIFLVTEDWNSLGTVRARGLQGAIGGSPGAGYGGGGGGGLVVATAVRDLATGTFTVNGGAAQPNAGAGGAGAAGGAGVSIMAKVA